VTVYEFPIRIGDNPSCSAGCPIAIGTKHRAEYKEDIDFTSTGRKSSKVFCVPADVRTKLLMEHGHEFHKIVRGTETNLKVQEQRRLSLKQTFGEGVKSFFSNGKTLKLPVLPLNNNSMAATSA
jgi:hypothetical protein